MEYVNLGRTGVKVSELCFGTMSFGGDADEETSRAMFDRCREEGINFFDTANIYNGGQSERILGRCISGVRDEVVVASKFCGQMGSDVNAQGGSRRHIRQAVEGSLRMLDTDYIDLYYIHYFDPETSIQQTLRALDDLVREGKILYAGASNWAAWQLAKALGISAGRGYIRFDCIQPMYNLVKRQVEVEILPLARAEGLAVVSYSPLGAGLLTGKYGIDKRPVQGRILNNDMYSKRYAEDSYYEIADDFVQYATERGIQLPALAVAWVKSHPQITAPIIGARNVEQLEGSLGALDVDMTVEWRREISELSYTPPPATDRLEEAGEA